MRINQDIRDYADAQGLDEQAALVAGLEEKAAQFRQLGGQLYSEG